MNYTQFCESVKSDELDRVLDKINNKLTLTDSENSFLKNYHNLKEDEMKNYALLSPDLISTKIEEFLIDKIKIICDIDNNHEEIESIHNDYENGNHVMILKNRKRVPLKDNCLYNLSFDNGTYWLEVEDEYYEKLPIKKDDEN